MTISTTYNSTATPSLRWSKSTFSYAVSVPFSALTFTGKETDCETGFSYFGARYYDPTLLTSFLSIDRYADKYPSLSPYHYCAWKPIRLTDPNGDSAWAINNKWDKRFISQYQQSVANIARGYRERGEQYTCEDFALSVLIDFASQNGLPVTITNGTGIYDARSDKYNDIPSLSH